MERGESFHHDPHEIGVEFSADQTMKIAVAALGLATAIFENLNSILCKGRVGSCTYPRPHYIHTAHSSA